MRKIVKGVFFGAIVLGGILGCVISMLQHQKSPMTERVVTYELAKREGFAATSSGGCFELDENSHYDANSKYFIPDETAIFGPFAEMPEFSIHIVGYGTVDNAGSSFANDYSLKRSSPGKRYQIDDNTIVTVEPTLYEDGEVYISVVFMQAEEVLGMPRGMAGLSLKTKEELTKEEVKLHDAFVAKVDEGRQDYKLYSPEQLSETAMDSIPALEYKPDSLHLVGYRDDLPMPLYDTPEN